MNLFRVNVWFPYQAYPNIKAVPAFSNKEICASPQQLIEEIRLPDIPKARLALALFRRGQQPILVPSSLTLRTFA